MLTSLICLRGIITLNTEGCQLTYSEELQVERQFAQAIVLINHNDIYIPSGAKLAIAQIKQLVTPSSDNQYLGDYGSTAALSIEYINSCSITWFASTFTAHEGQHRLNTGKFPAYPDPSAWKNELSACQTQLVLGKILGMTEYEINYLENDWMKDIPSMQQHMAGYKGPA